jgi:hypothetical protein
MHKAILFDQVPETGESTNVVVRVTQTVPQYVNHKMSFDNWFTSVPLQVYPYKKGALSMGTVYMTQIPN